MPRALSPLAPVVASDIEDHLTQRTDQDYLILHKLQTPATRP